ncbi:MAG: hypothetical protein Q8L11_03795 [Candidatus Moranbacteria bacterium]|nr:hypothetical protein [Candidatus Moranbacteria bacterium]
MGESLEDNPLDCPVPLEDVAKVWNGASLEKKRHFLRTILETFSNARVADDGQRIGLVEFNRLVEEKFCKMPQNIRGYVVLAFDSERRIFNCGQAKKVAGISV